MDGLNEKMDAAIWVAKSLFERKKTAGSSANISFLHEGSVYISGSGTCFGTLAPDCFSQITMEGALEEGISPSKEHPLHRILYQKSDRIQAVIHTHSFYSTIWSCLSHPDPRDVIPAYTPYLEMKLGPVALVPYAPPGSRELFELFREHLGDGTGYLLANHGPVVGGSDMMSAFYALEELEESARIAWTLRECRDARLIYSDSNESR